MLWATGSGNYSLELIAREDRDTKVGNGFTLAYRVTKVAEPDQTPALDIGPEAFATLMDENGNEVEVPDGGDLAEAIAGVMGVPADLLNDVEPSTVSAAKLTEKTRKPRSKKK